MNRVQMSNLFRRIKCEPYDLFLGGDQGDYYLQVRFAALDVESGLAEHQRG